MKSQYFALTILSMVGYGDFFPVSRLEMILGSIVMLVGVSYFSYIMAETLSIIEGYRSKLGMFDP